MANNGMQRIFGSPPINTRNTCCKGRTNRSTPTASMSVNSSLVCTFQVVFVLIFSQRACKLVGVAREFNGHEVTDEYRLIYSINSPT
jgi:hypothetical protein